MNIELQEMSIEDIHFDRLNPRLPSAVQEGTESDIIEYLALRTRLEDLMASIGENGFFKGEALVVTRDDNDRVIVLEGNRRLAALKLLKESSLVSRSKFETIARQAKHRPDTVPVYMVHSREDAWQYIGFRHISGVQRWDPLAKARYLKLLFNNTSSKKLISDRYRDVAREIGGRSNSIQRNLDALAAYEKIEEENFFFIEDLDEDTFQFGTFYTAAGNTNISKFIGLRNEENEVVDGAILDNDCLNINHLKELTIWMFDKKPDGSTILGESRNISKLGELLADKEGLSALRTGLSISSAMEKMGGSRNAFINDISKAIDYLKQANRNLHSVLSNDEEAIKKVNEAEQVLKVTTGHLQSN